MLQDKPCERGSEEEKREHDGCLKQALFHPSFGPKNRTFPTKRSPESGTPLLKEDTGDKENGNDDLQNGNPCHSGSFIILNLVKRKHLRVNF